MVSRRLQACFQQVSKHSVHLTGPSAAPLRSALTPGLAPRLVPRLLRFASRLVSSPLDCSAALRARVLGWRPDWSLGCSLRFAPRSPARPRFAPRFPGWRPDWSLDCFASLRARLPRSLLRCAPRSASWAGAPTGPSAAPLRLVSSRSTASLRFALVSSRSTGLRARAWAGAPTGPSTAPLRSAPRVFPRSTASLRSALALRAGAPDWSFGCLLRFALSCLPAPLRSALAPGLAPRLPLRVLHFASRAPG